MQWMAFIMRLLKSLNMKCLSTNPIITCLTFALLLSVSSAAMSAEKPGIFFNRHSIHMIDESNNIYLVSAQVDFKLTPYLEKALLNGVELKLNTYIGMGRHRDWWWNDAENISTISYQLKYHALSRHFLLTRNDTSENWNYRSLSAALRKMGSVVNYKLPRLSSRIKSGDYYLFMNIRLSPATLRLPLRIQSLFSNKYSMASEVVSWPLP
ncbi:DUF4390 domain-containing protein [Leucothrix sargassi]|nr:DUF4390 domain-containing protein [Leucothrix sargassi]